MGKNRQIPFRSLQLFCLVIFCFALLSCNILGGKDSENHIIVPGKSINNISIGDSEEQVNSLLGSPDAIRDKTDFNPPRTIYDYDIGLSVLFYMQDNSTIGPVGAVGVYQKYDGETAEGIRIGSSDDSLVDAYGGPDFIKGTSQDTTLSIAIYDYENGARTYFVIHSDIITAIKIGEDFTLPVQN